MRNVDAATSLDIRRSRLTGDDAQRGASLVGDGGDRSARGRLKGSYGREGRGLTFLLRRDGACLLRGRWWDEGGAPGWGDETAGDESGCYSCWSSEDGRLERKNDVIVRQRKILQKSMIFFTGKWGS